MVLVLRQIVVMMGTTTIGVALVKTKTVGEGGVVRLSNVSRHVSTPVATHPQP